MAKVIIVGGGAAGLACAAELSANGVVCVILEKRERLGGRANELSCKGQVHCRQCDVCRVHRLRDQVLRSALVTVHTGVELEHVERNNGRYRFDVRRPTEAIDVGRCSRCGKCAEACPTGAMIKVGGKIRFDRAICRSLQGLECERCVSVCPTGAIDLFGEEHLSVNGEVAVVATGALEFPAERDVRLGYGTVPGVITSMELESFLEGRSDPGIGQGARIAFLLCVGSRTIHEGTSMCSSVCCKYSLRQALSLKEKYPAMSITMFMMDWRGMDGDDLLLKELERTDIRVVRSRPAEIFKEGDGPAVRYASDGHIGCDRFDTAVLAVGLVPDLDDELIRQLALPRDAHGNLEPRNCRERGIFLAGSCLEPKDLRHCVIDGILAAKNALVLLEDEHD